MSEQFMPLLAHGARLENRYVILGVLGQGGMSRVYLADATHLGTRVAIKENLLSTEESRAQFEREARILATLSHPNIPRVIDHFVDIKTGKQYLVMDFIEGEDLNEIIKRQGSITETTALAWIHQILDALEYLHSQIPPVIHRDIKPSNIKITPQGKAWLVDFGISKTYDPRLTLTGLPSVTPGYAPPEQYGMRTSERSDIYALGATLYAMLTGKVPPEAPLRISGERLIPPSEFKVTSISPNVQRAILGAMALDTSKRWGTVQALRGALGKKESAKRGERPAQDIPKQRAKRTNLVPLLLASGAGVVGVLIIIGLAFAWGHSSNPTPVGIAANGESTATSFAASSSLTISPAASVRVISATTPSATPTRTQTPVPTTTPSPSVIVMYAAPSLVDPSSGAVLPIGKLTLRWNSLHSLNPDEVFDILVWPESTTQETSIGKVHDTNFSFDTSAWKYAGIQGKYFLKIQIERLDGIKMSYDQPFSFVLLALTPTPERSQASEKGDGKEGGGGSHADYSFK